jgi:hypothetical protein
MRMRSRSVQQVGVHRPRSRRLRRSGGGTWVCGVPVAANHFSGAAFRRSGELARQHLGQAVAVTLAGRPHIPLFRAKASSVLWRLGTLESWRGYGLAAHYGKMHTGPVMHSPHNISIDTDPQQQEAASPLMLVVRSFLRYTFSCYV